MATKLENLVDKSLLGAYHDQLMTEVVGAFEDEVRGLVDTPHQGYVTVEATSQTSAATDVLPASGQSADTIYRVSNWDGSTNSYDITVYSEYAWDDVSNPNKYIFLCVKPLVGEVFDITVYNNNTKYANLAAALGTNGVNVPASVRKGGMSIKYVNSSDNKYVQYRYMSTSTANANIANVANWQGVESEPTYNSKNLIESGGLYNFLKNFGEGLTNYKYLYGMNITQDGSLSSDGTQYPFVYDVEGIEYVFIKYYIYSGGAIAGYAFYNSRTEFTAASCLSVGNTYSSASPVSKEIGVRVPTGAKTLLVTQRGSDYPTVIASHVDLTAFVKNATLEVDKVSVVTSKKIGQDGSLVDGGTALDSWVFDVSDCYAFYLDYYFQDGGASTDYALYNSETTFDASTCVLLGNYGRGAGRRTTFIKVPEGAKRLLVSYRKSGASVADANAYCYVTNLEKVIPLIKKDITDLETATNARFAQDEADVNSRFNQEKVGKTLSFAARSPLALNPLDYVGVNDFHKVRFEGNIGEVYTTTSENVGNQWYTSKLPVQKGFDAIVIGRASSAFSTNIFVLDSNNVILSKQVVSYGGIGQPFYVRITDYQNAAYISFMYPSDDIQPVYFLPAMSEEHELQAEFRPKSEIKAYKYGGTLDPGDPSQQPFNNYRIDVSKLSNFIAYVHQLSGVGVMSISYFDKNDNYISSEYRQTATDVWNYLFCTVPQNASYAQILSRGIYEEEIVGNYRTKVYALTPSDANKYNDIVTNDIATKNVIQHEYSGERVSLNTFTIQTIGRGIITAAANNPIHPQDNTSGQGCCVYGDYLFRFHNMGFCNIYNIKYLDNITKVIGFELGSYGSGNHANCASFSPQIDTTTNFPYLYLGTGYGKCFVERISLTGSTLLQTITVSGNNGDIVIGDDGYLYLFNLNNTIMSFYKFNCPAVDAGDVTLTVADALDSWNWTDDAEDAVLQGGFFRNGKLYVCYGQGDGAARDVDRNINVFDWTKKDRVSYIPLKPYESHEPEDIYPYKGKIFMVVNGANEAYLIDFI